MNPTTDEQAVRDKRSPRPRMSMREFGRIYQPTYRDRKTRERKTSPTWWIAYYFRGTEHRESSHATDPKIARRLLKKRIGDMGSGTFIGPTADKVTVEDLCAMVTNDYMVNSRKSLKRAERALVHIKAFFAMKRAVSITGDQVTEYIKSRQEAQAMPATIRYELALLRRGFNLAVRARRLAYRPYIPSLEVRNTRSGFFERHEFVAVRSQLPEEIKPVVTMAFLTGWRVRSEILPIQWRQVDLRAGIVRLEPGTTKNDEGRTFPLSALSELSALFQAQWEHTQAVQKTMGHVISWLFHRNGKQIKDFTKAWSKATEAAGVPDRILHDFRRTAVRNLERAGVPRSVAMKLVGHKTEAIYRRYAVTSESDLSEGVRKLSALHAEEGTHMLGQKVVMLRRRKAHGKQAANGE